MEDKRYGKCFEICIKFGRLQQEIWKKECAGYTILSDPHELEQKAAVEVKSPINLLDILLEMTVLYFDHDKLMNNLSEMVEKRKLSDIRTEIIVNAHPYTGNEIPELISRLCNRHIYQNISPEDVDEIITRLNLLRHVFCVQPDPESGACLVVLEELAPYYSYSDNTWLIQPREKFRKAYEEFNRSRTVCVSQSQKDRFLLEEMKPSVEFISILLDGQIEVVFRREAIQTVLRRFQIKVKIDNYQSEIKLLENELIQFE